MKQDIYPSIALADKQESTTVERLNLGARLREIRIQNKLTLEEASKLTGLARSTLSKIENEQISPTFMVMQKLATGLSIDIPQLFSSPSKVQATGRRDVTRSGEGKPHPTSTYDHQLLATQLTNKKMMPYKTRVHARAFEDYPDWVRHDGEEFLFVLEGSITLFTEFYEPVRLDKGDSVYYDASMGHVVVSVSDADAEILWVTAE